VVSKREAGHTPWHSPVCFIGLVVCTLARRVFVASGVRLLLLAEIGFLSVCMFACLLVDGFVDDRV
jgi:hypothetical protein